MTKDRKAVWVATGKSAPLVPKVLPTSPALCPLTGSRARRSASQAGWPWLVVTVAFVR